MLGAGGVNLAFWGAAVLAGEVLWAVRGLEGLG